MAGPLVVPNGIVGVFTMQEIGIAGIATLQVAGEILIAEMDGTALSYRKSKALAIVQAKKYVSFHWEEI